MMADSAPASSSRRDPAPSASSAPKENEAGQASKLAHLETLLSAERRTLESISGGAALAETLQALCDSVDAHSPQIISSVLLMASDAERRRPAAGRRVPKGATDAISPLRIGPAMA